MHKEDRREDCEEERLFEESLAMDSHLRSQMTFVFFCCSSFVMLIVYIALDESFTTGSTLTAKSYHADLENLSQSLAVPAIEYGPKKSNREKDCLPVEHLAFLPMKRTKSFLLQSIFIHFGLKNHLSFAVPPNSSGSFRNGLGHQFSPMVGDSAKIIGYGLGGVEYDMICHDMILDAAKVYELMPPDTKFIGLVKDPVYHFKALWDSHRHKWSLESELVPYLHNSSDTMTNGADMKIFLKDPWTFLERPLSVYQDAALLKGHDFDKRRAKAEMSPIISSLLYTRNPQLATYGHDVYSTKELPDQLIKSMISSVQAQFQLILIDEYIDISLALIKHALCWTYKEVVTIASALHRPQSRPEYGDLGFTDEMLDQLKDFNKADFEFYRQMNETFWEQVQKYGENKIRTVAATIVESASKLQDRCVSRWMENGRGRSDFIPVIKEDARHLVECQRIELVRTTSITKTLQNRQRQLVQEQHEKWLNEQSEKTVEAPLEPLQSEPLYPPLSPPSPVVET